MTLPRNRCFLYCRSNQRYRAAVGARWRCPRCSCGCNNAQPRLKVPRDLVQASLAKPFEALFPVCLIKLVMIPMLSPSVTYGIFLRWIGAWFSIATMQAHCAVFWSTLPINASDGAPFHLSESMPHYLIEAVLSELAITKKEPPPWLGTFFGGSRNQSTTSTYCFFKASPAIAYAGLHELTPYVKAPFRHVCVKSCCFFW